MVVVSLLSEVAIVVGLGPGGGRGRPMEFRVGEVDEAGLLCPLPRLARASLLALKASMRLRRNCTSSLSPSSGIATSSRISLANDTSLLSEMGVEVNSVFTVGGGLGLNLPLAF